MDSSLMDTLRARFEANMGRHAGVTWPDVTARLSSSAAGDVIAAMESTGGEPDLIVSPSGEWLYMDCSRESPEPRRSLCYDRAALDARKANKPVGDAVSAARAMGAELIDEAQYALLQSVGEFDLKTSSWLLTPAPVRALGGSLFGDRRYDRVFVFHNGADSYYASRGFRVFVRL